MVIFPILVIIFFTSLMNEGQPVEMPVGVVDQDNTTTSRKLCLLYTSPSPRDS